jgi:hypothetical protein
MFDHVRRLPRESGRASGRECPALRHLSSEVSGPTALSRRYAQTLIVRLLYTQSRGVFQDLDTLKIVP